MLDSQGFFCEKACPQENTPTKSRQPKRRMSLLWITLLVLTLLMQGGRCSGGCGKVCQVKQVNKALRRQIDFLGERLLKCLTKIPLKANEPLVLGKDMPSFLFESPRGFTTQKQLASLVHEMKLDINMCKSMDFIARGDDNIVEDMDSKANEINTLGDPDVSSEKQNTEDTKYLKTNRIDEDLMNDDLTDHVMDKAAEIYSPVPEYNSIPKNAQHSTQSDFDQMMQYARGKLPAFHKIQQNQRSPKDRKTAHNRLAAIVKNIRKAKHHKMFSA